MSTFSRHRKKRLRNFERRSKFNGSPDREIGTWQIIDIHQIPEKIGENQRLSSSFSILQEFDFYCKNTKDFYFLRIRKWKAKDKISHFSIVKSCLMKDLIYLIAELNFAEITDEFIGKILGQFEKIGIPKYRSGKIKISKNFDFL